MRDRLSQIIINVEAQKDEPNGYDILNRAIFYVSRMISSQKERDFQIQIIMISSESIPSGFV